MKAFALSSETQPELTKVELTNSNNLSVEIDPDYLSDSTINVSQILKPITGLYQGRKRGDCFFIVKNITYVVKECRDLRNKLDAGDNYFVRWKIATGVKPKSSYCLYTIKYAGYITTNDGKKLKKHLVDVKLSIFQDGLLVKRINTSKLSNSTVTGTKGN